MAKMCDVDECGQVRIEDQLSANNNAWCHSQDSKEEWSMSAMCFKVLWGPSNCVKSVFPFLFLTSAIRLSFYKQTWSFRECCKGGAIGVLAKELELCLQRWNKNQVRRRWFEEVSWNYEWRSNLLSFLAVFALFCVFCPLTGRCIACRLPT